MAIYFWIAVGSALGGMARLEQEVFGRVQRIAAERAAALGPLARILEAVEEISAGGSLKSAATTSCGGIGEAWLRNWRIQSVA